MNNRTPDTIEVVAVKYIQAALEEPQTIAEQISKFAELEKTMVEENVDAEALIKTIGERLVQSFPQEMTWTVRRQVLLHLTHLEEGLLGEKSDLTETIKNGIQLLVHLQKKLSPEKPYDLGDFAIIDLERLANKFEAALDQIKKKENYFFQTAGIPLAIADITVMEDCFTGKKIYNAFSAEPVFLHMRQKMWLDAAKKILDVEERPSTVVPLKEKNDLQMEAMTHFVAVTLCKNLGVTDLRIKDIAVLRRLCEKYLTMDPVTEDENYLYIVRNAQDKYIRLELEDVRNQSLNAGLYALIMHLSVMISNLQLFRDLFSLGFVRILDRPTAQNEVEQYDSVVVRIGLGSGGAIVSTEKNNSPKAEEDFDNAKEEVDIKPYKHLIYAGGNHLKYSVDFLGEKDFLFLLLGYGICVLEKGEPLQEKDVEADNLYLQEKDGCIAYTVLTPQQKVVTHVIDSAALKAPNNFNEEELDKLKIEILKIASQAGHVPLPHRSGYSSWIPNPTSPSVVEDLKKVSAAKTLISYDMYINPILQEEIKAVRKRQVSCYWDRYTTQEERINEEKPVSFTELEGKYAALRQTVDILLKNNHDYYNKVKGIRIQSALKKKQYDNAWRLACSIKDKDKTLNPSIEAMIGSGFFTSEVIAEQHKDGASSVLQACLSLSSSEPRNQHKLEL